MSWLELDDRILEHPKFIRAIKLAGSEAVHLWLGIRAYCGQNLTDGFVPEDMLDEVRGPAEPKRRAKALAALRTVGLLDQAEAGVQMHDYLEWSSSREDVLARRESARERKRRSRGGPVGGAQESTETDTERPNPSRRDVARTAGGVRGESQTPARAFSTPLPLPSKPDLLTAAADPRPVSLPRATAPSAAAAAAADRVLDSLEEERPEPVTQTQVRERLPGNLAEALAVPICVRAELVTSGRVAAQWLEPQKWPEVYELEIELAKAEGRKPLPLGSYDRDGAVRTVVELYAAGYLPGTLRDVVRKLPSEPFWNQPGKRRDLSNLSAVVVRKSVTGDTGDAAGRELLARVDASLAKGKRSQPDEGGTQLGSLLGSIGGAR